MQIKKCHKCAIELETYPKDGSKQTKTSWFCPECVRKVIEQRILKSGLKEGEYYLVNGTVVKKKFTEKNSCTLHYYTCKYCNKLHVSQYKNRKYCSKDCYSLDTVSDRRDYYEQYKKDNYQYAPVISFKCEVCGSEFSDNKPNRKFCSYDCQRVHVNNNRPEYVRVDHKCITCGKSSGRKKYCSKECIPKKFKPLHKVSCKTCGVEFETKNPKTLHCSKDCYRKDPEIKEKRNRLMREKRKLNGGINYTKVKGKTNIREKIRKRNRKHGKHTLKGIPLDLFIEIEKKRVAGQETDHIIPLNGELVCGLNVPWNLQLLTCEANNFKSNKFDGTYDNRSWIDEFRKKKSR